MPAYPRACAALYHAGVADVLITEYTDPGCPWAYSRRAVPPAADLALRRPPGVAVAARRPRRAPRGLRASAASRPSARPRPTPRSPATTACRSTRACARAWPRPSRPAAPSWPPACTRPNGRAPLLRRLRVRNFSGELLDEPSTIAAAAARRGPRPGAARALDGRARGRERAARGHGRGPPADARRPRARPQARQLVGRAALHLPVATRSCALTDGVRIAVPGFQPFAVYDVVIANLVPGLDRRDPPATVEEVLRWTGTPLATKEVAVVLRHLAAERARRSAAWPSSSTSASTASGRSRPSARRSAGASRRGARREDRAGQGPARHRGHRCPRTSPAELQPTRLPARGRTGG